MATLCRTNSNQLLITILMRKYQQKLNAKEAKQALEQIA